MAIRAKCIKCTFHGDSSIQGRDHKTNCIYLECVCGKMLLGERKEITDKLAKRAELAKQAAESDKGGECSNYTCSRCRSHGIVVPKRFHEPCPYSLCECDKCENSAKKKTVEQELADLKGRENQDRRERVNSQILRSILSAPAQATTSICNTISPVAPQISPVQSAANQSIMTLNLKKLALPGSCSSTPFDPKMALNPETKLISAHLDQSDSNVTHGPMWPVVNQFMLPCSPPKQSFPGSATASFFNTEAALTPGTQAFQSLLNHLILSSKPVVPLSSTLKLQLTSEHLQGIITDPFIQNGLIFPPPPAQVFPSQLVLPFSPLQLGANQGSVPISSEVQAILGQLIAQRVIPEPSVSNQGNVSLSPQAHDLSASPTVPLSQAERQPLPTSQTLPDQLVQPVNQFLPVTSKAKRKTPAILGSSIVSVVPAKTANPDVQIIADQPASRQEEVQRNPRKRGVGQDLPENKTKRFKQAGTKHSDDVQILYEKRFLPIGGKTSSQKPALPGSSKTAIFQPKTTYSDEDQITSHQLVQPVNPVLPVTNRSTLSLNQKGFRERAAVPFGQPYTTAPEVQTISNQLVQPANPVLSVSNDSSVQLSLEEQHVPLPHEAQLISDLIALSETTSDFSSIDLDTVRNFLATPSFEIPTHWDSCFGAITELVRNALRKLPIFNELEFVRNLE